MSLRHMLHSETTEHSISFLQGMIDRMDMSSMKYGPYQQNAKGEYTEEFMKDFVDTFGGFVARWGSKVTSSTSACTNILMFGVIRMLAYVKGYKGPRGNREFLMDAANALMMEYDCPQVPGAYFQATDGKGSPETRGSGFTVGEASRERAKNY